MTSERWLHEFYSTDGAMLLVSWQHIDGELIGGYGVLTSGAGQHWFSVSATLSGCYAADNGGRAAEARDLLPAWCCTETLWRKLWSPGTDGH